MKKIVIIIIIVVSCLSAKSQNIVGLYSIKTKYFCYGLQINADSTFVFSDNSNVDVYACEGKWKIEDEWRLILECEEESITSQIAYNIVNYMCERIIFIDIVNDKTLKYRDIPLKKVKKCDCLYSRKRGKL